MPLIVRISHVRIVGYVRDGATHSNANAYARDAETFSAIS
jgi:hypothetical protein